MCPCKIYIFNDLLCDWNHIFKDKKKNRIHLNSKKNQRQWFLFFFIIIEHYLPLFLHPIDDAIFPTEALKPIFKLHVQKSELNLLWNADNDTTQFDRSSVIGVK